MDTPSISVLIPAYNVERHLPECLDSILSQGGRRIEVIVADDGSTDGTGRILAEYARKDARLRFFRLPHAGAYAARNRLLDEAEGKWVYLCDADDKLAPGAFARLLSVAEAEEPDAVFFGAEVMYDSPELEARFPDFKGRYAFSRDFSAPRTGQDFFCDCMDANEWKALVWLVLLRREMPGRTALRFEAGQVHKDDIFVLDAALRARKALRIPDCLYSRRIREDSLMTTRHPVEDFACYVQNALWTVARAGDGTLSGRTRAALGTIADRMFRKAGEAFAETTEAERKRLAAEYPVEDAVARLFSKTRTEEEFRRQKDAVARRNRKIALLEKKIASLHAQLEAQRRENRRIRSSRAFRLGNALLAFPRFLFRRRTKT
ncbi:MAG: glycosyltransferase [Kiritimatiellae bacterium]|nr:glycosyltransferase [Kiritimatiellia bacterium]